MVNKIVLVVFSSLFSFSVAAQDTANSTLGTFKIGVFAPLYLDSVFNDDNFRYERNFPRFVVQGLDFIQGAQIALDSMPLPNGNIDAHFYDSKSEYESIDKLINTGKLDSLHLIIGSVKDEEFLTLADFALRKKIPFISATYPNDGGVTQNPYLVIVNSTLRAHCEAIFSYILQNHGMDEILLVRKAGVQEDKVAGYFSAFNKPDGKPLLNIRTINIDSNYNIVRNRLDSTRKNIIIGGSLDEDFAFNLCSAIQSSKKKYDVTLLGMPNWNTFQSLSKKNLSNFTYYFTSPYYNDKNDNYSRMVQDVYLKKYKGKPSELAYKGFETIFIFSRIFTRYPDNFMQHLNDYAYKVFSEYNFKPVLLNQQTGTPDYFENKHLYFIRMLRGISSKAW